MPNYSRWPSLLLPVTTSLTSTQERSTMRFMMHGRTESRWTGSWHGEYGGSIVGYRSRVWWNTQANYFWELKIILAFESIVEYDIWANKKNLIAEINIINILQSATAPSSLLMHSSRGWKPRVVGAVPSFHEGYWFIFIRILKFFPHRYSHKFLLPDTES